ncbi:MAG: YraN family protein [Prevotellaceae bacterium]|jgi:putative endonuclease|nr:YraN family protein [Prevotellaceae bacterium]
MGVTQKIGNKGEIIAQNYLLQNGFRILHTNWRFGYKELDIVATRNSYLHVIEVKTRTSQFWENPKDAVVIRKQKNIIDAADAYISKYNINMDARFDVISIVLTGETPEIEYIPEAFSPVF